MDYKMYSMFLVSYLFFYFVNLYSIHSITISPMKFLYKISCESGPSVHVHSPVVNVNQALTMLEFS